VEQLDHETRETTECARDADTGIDFDEDTAGSVDIDL
jgi:hypothetical protein